MKKPCNYPGCAALIERGTHCPAHADTPKQRRRDYETHRRQRNPELKLSQKMRNSVRWRKVRALKLADSPLCEDPLGLHARDGTTRTATQVHHIKPLVSHPELAYHESNLMSVCHGCHSKVEKQTPRTRDDGDKPADEPFNPFG